MGLDLPDENGRDTNCDGIDGDESLAVFVDAINGSNSNPGTKAQPFQTIGRALSSGRPQILVGRGTYAEALGLGTGNFGIWGGYDPSSSWARTAARPTLTQAVTVRGDGGTLTLDFLRVTTANSTSSRSAVYALVVEEADAGVTISRCELVAGRGGDGASGQTGPAGGPGGPGQPGGGGADGGAGGLGGSSVCGAPGLAGGRGGDLLALDGERVDGGAPGGAGFLCLSLPCDGGAGSGGDGLAGAAGAAGTPGANGTGIGFIASNWRWAPVDGQDGAAGAAGQPGQIAGGGGAVFEPDSGVLARGGGAGGTGAGGCPGGGGTFGQSGGASIAVLLVHASPVLDRCVIQTAGGGDGANGGPGGPGGAGGLGGLGGEGEVLPEFAGGDGGVGGRGGSGGQGGAGGRGGGGPSIGVWCVGPSTPTLTTPSFIVGPGGAGATTGVSSQFYGTCP